VAAPKNISRISIPPLAWFNILSLDIALAVAAGTALLYNDLGNNPEWYKILVLTLGVWCIYTADRLFGSPSPMLRHKIAAKYKLTGKVLLSIATLATLTGVICFFSVLDVLFLLLPAFVLAGYFLFYFFSRYFELKFYSKEVVVAAGFTLGLAALPLSNADADIWDLFGIWPWIVGIWIAAFLNMAVLSGFERNLEGKNSDFTLANWLAPQAFHRLIWSLSMGLFLISCLGALLMNLRIQSAIAFSAIAIAYLSMYLNHRFWSKNERFRWSADAILLLWFLALIP
jgi:hypothetical protein